MDNNWVIQNLESALETWNRHFAEIVQLLSTGPESFRGGGVWQVIVGINGALMAVAYALLALFFVMGMFKTASGVSELKRPEIAVKMFIRFACAQAAITYCMDIMLALFAICQGILSTVVTQAGAISEQTAALPAEISQAILDAGFWQSIPLWLVTILGSILVTVLSFVMIFTVYGRFFRIYCYTAIAPVALSTFAGEGTAHYGTAFLKSYTAVCLEGVIIVVACMIFSSFASAPPQSVTAGELTAVQLVWNYVAQLAFNLLVLVGTVKMSERLTKEMLGL